jgi:hypothetical protein
MEEKTFRVSIFGRELLSQSLDSNVVDGRALVWSGAKSIVPFGFFNQDDKRLCKFLTKEGKRVYTTLPVLIEEE